MENVWASTLNYNHLQDEIIMFYIQQAKEKRAVNLTPKKILHFEEATPTIPDLRLEAKMTREVSFIVCCCTLTNLRFACQL